MHLPASAHDTLRIVVHDTTVIRDTVVRVAEAARPGSIGARDLIGWGVTTASIVAAAIVARIGWMKSAEAGLAAQREHMRLADERAVLVLKDAIREALAGAIMYLPMCVAQLEALRYLPKSNMSLLDAGMQAYRRNRDNIVLWPDKAQRDHIQLWFREAEHWRQFLEDYVEREESDRPNPALHPDAVRRRVKFLTHAVEQARSLYLELDLPRVSADDPDFEKWGGTRQGPPAPPPATA